MTYFAMLLHSKIYAYMPMEGIVDGQEKTVGDHFLVHGVGFNYLFICYLSVVGCVQMDSLAGILGTALLDDFTAAGLPLSLLRKDGDD